MRLKVVFESTVNSKLSFDYQYRLTGLVYHLLAIGNDDLAAKYHTSNSFKPFSFSWLHGEHKILDDGIIFKGSIEWFITSPSEEFIKAILVGLISSKNIKIENANFKLVDVKILDEPLFERKMTFKTLSPVLVRGFKKGKKNPHYDLSPTESQFYINLQKNLIKKYLSIFGSEPEDKTFNVLEIINPIQKRIKIKNEFYRGWMMRFKVEGNPELLKLAYQVGLGEKNPMGFGMLMVV